MAISETAVERRTARAGVVVSGITKRFGQTEVLQGSDLEVAPGSVLTLLGPSGCGKTTLLRVIAGLERPDAGSVAVGERVVAAPPHTFVAPEGRRIGMVFQEAALFPHLTVAGNVGYGLPRRERASARVTEALSLVGLEAVASRQPAQLSGGQQQRVALARALVTEPEVILLDEPFASLDAPLRSQLRMEVKRVLREIRATAIFVTHDQEEAFLIGDQVAVMVDGRILQQDTPSEVYERPASWQVASFLGDANFLPGQADGRTAQTLIGSVPLHEERRGSVAVMVRPEWIAVTTGRGPQVEAVEFYGHDSIYILRADDGARIRARVMGAPRHRVGDRVACRFLGPAATVFGGAGLRLAAAGPPERGAPVAI